MAKTFDQAMIQALSNLDRITSHLRKHGQDAVANKIGKLSVGIVEAFDEAIEKLPSDQFPFEDKPADGGHRDMTKQTTDRDTIQKQAVMALMNEVEKEKREPLNMDNRALQAIPINAGPPLQPGSWAQIASSSSTLKGSSQEAAQFASALSIVPFPVSKKSQDNEEEGLELAASGELVTLPPAMSEIAEAKAGILRIYGRISRDVIPFITTRIHEGPLQDIRVETNGRTRVVFQHVSHALAFLKSNQDMEAMLGFGRFGCGYKVELAEIVDWNDDHRRMNQPIRERRRLSFARKRLFADNMSPDKWKHDVRALAGPGNIDFLWVFNSGNATAVFTSTVVARKVLEVFNKWKEGRNVYSGVSVTFSSDPCEKELVLVRESNRNVKHLGKRPIR